MPVFVFSVQNKSPNIFFHKQIVFFLQNFLKVVGAYYGGKGSLFFFPPRTVETLDGERAGSFAFFSERPKANLRNTNVQL